MPSMLLVPALWARRLTIATWNVRTLRAAGKLDEPLRVRWTDTSGISLDCVEMRWKMSGEIPNKRWSLSVLQWKGSGVPNRTTS